jgi:hypothetical protein
MEWRWRKRRQQGIVLNPSREVRTFSLHFFPFLPYSFCIAGIKTRNLLDALCPPSVGRCRAESWRKREKEARTLEGR